MAMGDLISIGLVVGLNFKDRSWIMWEFTSMISSCIVVMMKRINNLNDLNINSINKSIRFQLKSHYLAITFSSHGSTSFHHP